MVIRNHEYAGIGNKTFLFLDPPAPFTFIFLVYTAYWHIQHKSFLFSIRKESD